MSNPFYFLHPDDERKKAEAAWEADCIKNQRVDTQSNRDSYILGWILVNYTKLFEYLQEMQAEAKD